MGEVPIGIKVIQIVTTKCCPSKSINRNYWHKANIFFLTFITYMCYHASRKPLSVVKTYLNHNCTNRIPTPGIIINDSNRETWCNWAPFDHPDASILLGYLDSAFLFAYAVAMFFSGFVADRISLRYFLAMGMITSGISCYIFGIAHYYNIHSLSYFLIAQIFGGIVQTTGWPGVVAVMGNWYGKEKRGLIFGLWNSHTSLGNIVGGLIAGWFLDIDWGLSFIIPGVMIAAAGLINFLFLIDSPEDVGCQLPEISKQPCNTFKQSNESGCELEQDDSAGSETELLAEQFSRPILFVQNNEVKAIGFSGALKIPGVIEYSLSLFFAKLVSYTFLYWLPAYIKSSTSLSATLSSYVSTIFDVGGILGGIIAGYITDSTGLSATTCSVMLIISIPLLPLYNLFGAVNVFVNIIMLIILGFFVNGPYALITTAVSADLGTHRSLSGNSKALATVSAIIDGTGSIGAALGPLLAGVISTGGWEKVFYLLMASDALALLMLTRLVIKEWNNGDEVNSNI